MEGDASDRERYLQIDIPPEVRRGVYANTLTMWFSPYEFAFDWGLAERFEPEDPEDPTSPVRMPMLIVSRVRLPTALVFDVLRALNQAMTDYEAIFGEIRRPEAR
jgi:Protein of unknown function (DUF3467)